MLENALRILESSVARLQWNQQRAVRDPDFSAIVPAIEAMGTRERSQIVQSPDAASFR